KYSSLAAGGPLAAQLVTEQYDLALQVNKPGEGWVEPLGCRFVVTDDGSDPTKEEGIIEITGIGVVEYDLSGVLGRTLGVAATYDADSGRWAFTSASAGRILRAYLDSHFSHHSIAPTFTASQDSAGQPWAIQFSRLELEPTRNALQILQALSDQGLVDWISEGNQLHAYNADTALKRSNLNVELMFGRDVADGPQRRSRRDFASDVLAVGENGKVYYRSNPAEIESRRGRRAVAASGSISNDADAILASEAIFAAQGRLVREQMTRSLDFTAPKFLPLLDYRAGDEVMAPGKEGRPEQLRIRQITVQGAGGEATGGSIVLNDRFLEASVRTARRMARLDGGAGTGVGGSTPSVPEAGKRVPAAPPSGTASVTIYRSEYGNQEGLVTISWAGVDEDVDGVPISIERYEIRARRTD